MTSFGSVVKEKNASWYREQLFKKLLHSMNQKKKCCRDTIKYLRNPIQTLVCRFYQSEKNCCPSEVEMKNSHRCCINKIDKSFCDKETIIDIIMQFFSWPIVY